MRNRGFTLTELLVMFVLLGILAAITAPNILGMWQRSVLNSNFNMVRAALQEAQAQAIRRSRDCVVTLGTITAEPAGCLLEERNLAGGVEISAEDEDGANVTEISYNFRGETDPPEDAQNGDVEIRISDDRVNNLTYCIIVSDGLGLVRSGMVEDNNCVIN